MKIDSVYTPPNYIFIPQVIACTLTHSYAVKIQHVSITLKWPTIVYKFILYIIMLNLCLNYDYQNGIQSQDLKRDLNVMPRKLFSLDMKDGWICRPLLAYFSLTPNQHQPSANQQYFSLIINQYQPQPAERSQCTCMLVCRRSNNVPNMSLSLSHYQG